MTTTADRIRKIVIAYLDCDPEKATDDAKLEDMGADSLDAVEITMAIEEEFDIEFRDEEADQVDTIATAAKLVDAKLAAA